MAGYRISADLKTYYLEKMENDIHLSKVYFNLKYDYIEL